MIWCCIRRLFWGTEPGYEMRLYCVKLRMYQKEHQQQGFDEVQNVSGARMSDRGARQVSESPLTP